MVTPVSGMFRPAAPVLPARRVRQHAVSYHGPTPRLVGYRWGAPALKKGQRELEQSEPSNAPPPTVQVGHHRPAVAGVATGSHG